MKTFSISRSLLYLGKVIQMYVHYIVEDHTKFFFVTVFPRNEMQLYFFKLRFEILRKKK